MREMVLNHTSLAAGDSHAAIGFLKDVVPGMAQLVEKGVTAKVLRTTRHLWEIPCALGFSLYDATEQLRRDGAREEYGFLVGMMVKAPLLSDVGAAAEHRFLTCEVRGLSQGDGEPLLLCALTGGVAIGFPTSAEWDRDRVTVVFNELQPDETTFSEETEDIDHLARSSHAAPIYRRHQERLRAGSNPGELWDNRQTIFPYLVFGPDVEGHLRKVPRLHTLIKRLAELNDDAERWRRDGGAMPQWTRKVVNESDSARKNPRLREARRFGSCSGGTKLFLWHVRFGRGWRIHLRFDEKCREVEIGYIGPHL